MPAVQSLFCWIALLAFVGCTSDPPRADGPAVEVKMALALQAETPVIKRGDIPRFRAQLINQGTEPVTVVLPGDGSDCGWRTPVLRWSPAMPSGGRCGNINALKADEVVTVQAGQRVLLPGWLGWPSLAAPGIHKVTLEFQNIPGLQWQGGPLGQHDRQAMEKVRRSQPFKAVSNTVEIVVQD